MGPGAHEAPGPTPGGHSTPREAATGALILLIGISAAITALVGAVSGGAEAAVNRVTAMSSGDLQSAGIVSAIVLLIIWFVAYFIGGYVAGRMARFNGARQGVAVWLWAIIVAVVLAIVGAIVGQNVGANISGLPALPVNSGQLTTAGIISGIVVLVVALIGAVLGGLSGMRYHRRIDRAALEG
ncbi:hypothetical protein GCM10011512_00610 [Tersicoccus solisilvae]|uniref:Major facilitator superfamily (MFS) profile domain-containing protein n=1 Tax=Tersicoccus solisilvae TaxID=1882339 RepID=A0ABQ1NIA4_9MICC|nr:hypothetical protein GCM10011512_00610 [Tersicoccus solisilvae]